jgi:ATP adenylyltransferase
MRDYLFNMEKLKYVQGDKPNVDCILCAIREHNPAVPDLSVYRDASFIIAMNLYPFNSGHLMLFPVRHIEQPGELSDDEALQLHRLSSKAIEILKEEFNPAGFNVGYNIGKGSGASIPHLHLHIVPRYNNEVGFLDVLAGTRVMVVDPREARDRLRQKFSLFAK